MSTKRDLSKKPFRRPLGLSKSHEKLISKNTINDITIDKNELIKKSTSVEGKKKKKTKLLSKSASRRSFTNKGMDSPQNELRWMQSKVIERQLSGDLSSNNDLSKSLGEETYSNKNVNLKRSPKFYKIKKRLSLSPKRLANMKKIDLESINSESSSTGDVTPRSLGSSPSRTRRSSLSFSPRTWINIFGNNSSSAPVSPVGLSPKDNLFKKYDASKFQCHQCLRFDFKHRGDFFLAIHCTCNNRKKAWLCSRECHRAHWLSHRGYGCKYIPFEKILGFPKDVLRIPLDWTEYKYIYPLYRYQKYYMGYESNSENSLEQHSDFDSSTSKSESTESESK
tara:strand:+ start:2102 stop:3112 length:1011 start_codon:yes stop_codon:yes gene_type:complete